MDAPRILKTRNSSISYQVIKRNRSSLTSTHLKRSNSKSKPKPLKHLEAANSLPRESPLFSPALSLESLSVGDSEFEDSDEELVELPSQLQSIPIPNSLDFYKNKMKDLAKNYKEIIDQNSPSEGQKMSHSRCIPSSSSSSSTSTSTSSSTNRTNGRSQEDINNANLLLLLRMVE